MSMSRSPATPDKSIDGLGKYSKVAVPSREKLASTSRVKNESIHEPSPASTYGDTAAGDSVPATPLKTPEYDDTAILIHSLRKAQLEGETAGHLSGSPIEAHDSKNRPFAEQREERTQGRVASSLYASPSKSNERESLLCHTSAKSSPDTDRYKQIVESPSWRRGELFVRQSRDRSEDPFVTSTISGLIPASASPVTFRPRDDRMGLELSPDNAQAILPPNACVFVANLSHTKSDEDLEGSVTAVFQTFGTVYVKIRRDNKGMPFAFCQYENAADAQRAIILGRGMPIDGRPCRTEVAKVNRSLYLSRVTGGSISEGEAREILNRFGALEKVWYCSQTDKEMFRLPEGIWVMFAFFQDCRDAQAGFRDDPSYRLEQPKIPDDMHARLGSRPFHSPVSPLHRSSPNNGYASPQAAIRRASDLCSIFVGNLPADADDAALREAFRAHGHIHQIEIIRKPTVNANGVNGFAFIEFFSQEEAARAARGNYKISDTRLRVERKETIEPSPRRNMSILTGGSPRNRYLADNEAMALMFQRGLSIGLANATASPAPPMAPPSFAPYPYYQALNPQTAFNPYIGQAVGVDDEASANLHIQGNPFMPQPMTQYQYPQDMIPYGLGQFPARQNSYQWPPSNANADGNTAPSGPSGPSGAAGGESK